MMLTVNNMPRTLHFCQWIIMFGAVWIIFSVVSSYCNYYLKKKKKVRFRSIQFYYSLLACPVAPSLPRQVSCYCCLKVCSAETSSGTTVTNLMAIWVFQSLWSLQRGDPAKGWESFPLAETVGKNRDQDPISPDVQRRKQGRTLWTFTPLLLL